MNKVKVTIKEINSVGVEEEMDFEVYPDPDDRDFLIADDVHRAWHREYIPLNEPVYGYMELILNEYNKKSKAINKEQSSKQLKDALNAFNAHDLGKSYYSVRLDNRLLIEMKTRELNITKFINEAILEKLTRDN